MAAEQNSLHHHTAANHQFQSADDLPQLLIHRIPSFNVLPLTRLLSRHFRLIDPHLQPSHSPSPPLSLGDFLALHAPAVRAVVVVGLCPFTDDHLRLLPSLELVAGTAVGTDHIDVSSCRRRGVAVTHAGYAFTEDVADYAVALLIDVLRRVSAADRYVRSGLWPVRGEYKFGSKLGGKRIGIVGLGRIGSEVAKRLRAFGCRVAYTSRKEKPSVPFPFYADVRELASESDVLVVCCSLTPETHHMINKDVMKVLGKEGVIINVGRGALVDEQELVRFLMQGEISGAGLDVFEDEPNVPKELFDLDNVVLSPHAAVITSESIESMAQLVLANLTAFFAGESLLSPVEKDHN